MSDITTDTATLQNLVSETLDIPYYQRPYKWKVGNVLQLLDDIYLSYNQRKETYRIGSIILHKENEKLNIVDGQQRLVTICLILYKLQEFQNDKINLSLLNSSFSHIESKNNIKFNYQAIEKWLMRIHAQHEKEMFLNYILSNCDFVKIQIDNLSEAFQLFDSQNARGKALEAYDLLKAFHLRAMVNNSQKEKLICVKKWEEQIDNGGLLGRIIGHYLYRIRKWSKGDKAGQFTKDDINEFKGIDIEEFKNYPYLKGYIMNDVITSNMESNPINYCFTKQIDYPFQINQLIINGKRFFEYVNFYSELHENIFVKSKTEFYTFYKSFVKYNGYGRKGDTYVRKMFKALTLLYKDKFGDEHFDNFYKLFYCWAFTIRLKLYRIPYASIDKYIYENINLFKMINEKYHPHQLNEIKQNLSMPEVKYPVSKIEEVFKQL